MGSLDSTLPGPQVRFPLFLDSLVGRCSTNSRSFHIFRVCFGRRSHYLCRYSRQSPLPCFPKKRDPHIHQPSRRSILPLTKSARRLPLNKRPFKPKRYPRSVKSQVSLISLNKQPYQGIIRLSLYAYFAIAGWSGLVIFLKQVLKVDKRRCIVSTGIPAK